MIVGTAGHIDHGKTTLVRALTGLVLAHTVLSVPYVLITVLATLQGFNAQDLPLAHAAAAALLSFAEHTQGRALAHVRSLQVERSADLARQARAALQVRRRFFPCRNI